MGILFEDIQLSAEPSLPIYASRMVKISAQNCCHYRSSVWDSVSDSLYLLHRSKRTPVLSYLPPSSLLRSFICGMEEYQLTPINPASTLALFSMPSLGASAKFASSHSLPSLTKLRTFSLLMANL